ncbi:hypothetical protein F5Y04DRAFT_290035 [Hypomontagnella monticulosa]|nr:hypothetical protein F5Y04DRAFT_290035 [Hypomontagnella monticulosa]
MSREEVNLDHLILRIPSSADSPEREVVLNAWVSDDRRGYSRQRSSDFDYDEFRKFLETELNIPPTAELVASISEKPIRDKHDFWVLLTRIQSGYLKLSDGGNLLTLEPAEFDPVGNPNSASTPRKKTDSVSTPKKTESAETPVLGFTDSPGANILVDDDQELESSRASDEMEVYDNNAYLNKENIELGFVDSLDWEETCEFFQCEKDVKSIEIPGLRIRPHNYQMYAIWWIFQRPCQGMPAAMLGDDTGLGKSGVALAIAVLHHQIHLAMKEVEVEWRRKPPIHECNHLQRRARSTSSSKLVCPSQKSSKYIFQCPCVPGSTARGVAESMLPSPCIFVVPPNLMEGTWSKQVAAWIDRSPRSPSSDMEVTYYHDDFRSDPRHHGKTAMRYTAVSDRHMRWDMKKKRWILEPSREKSTLASRYIIFVSQRSVESLQSEYKVTRQEPHGGLDQHFSNLAISFMFMDEIQDYVGHKGQDTIPFTALRRFRDHSRLHPVPVGLSASFRGGGPRYWRPFFDYVFQTTGFIQSLDSYEELDQHESDFEFFVNRLTREDAKPSPEVDQQLQERKGRLKTFLEFTVTQLLLARLKGGHFRGVLLGSRPVDIIEETHNMPSGPVRDTHKVLRASVKKWVHTAWEQRKLEWANNRWKGDIGKEPSYKEVEAEMLEAAYNKDLDSIKSYDIIIRSAVFPAVARIVIDSKTDISYHDLLNAKIKPLANMVTKALQAESQPGSRSPNTVRTTVLEALKKSKFWKFRQELMDTSPKFNRLVEYIKHIIGLKTVPHHIKSGFPDPGLPPADGSGVRHMLVFTDSPFSAFLLFMCLYSVFDTQIDWIYMHSGTAMKQRTPLTDSINDRVKRGGKNKIMVSTFELNGTGLNLQRANYCFLMEHPKIKTTQRQATGRLDRQGQLANAVLVQFLDELNLSESMRCSRGTNRRALADLTIPGHLERVEALNNTDTDADAAATK